MVLIFRFAGHTEGEPISVFADTLGLAPVLARRRAFPLFAVHPTNAIILICKLASGSDLLHLINLVKILAFRCRIVSFQMLLLFAIFIVSTGRGDS